MLVMQSEFSLQASWLDIPIPTVFFMSSRLVASHSLESHPCDPAGAWASFWGDAQVRQLVNYPFFDRNDGKVMGSQT